jgi:lipoprotein-releasing system permease protein
MDLARVYLDKDVLRRLAGVQDEYLLIRVKLKDPATAAAVKSDFAGRFPEFLTTTWEDHRADYLRAVNNEKVLLAIVLSFIVLLGGFIILATLTLTVVEKTKDIGVLSALGATRRGVLHIFVGNGLLMGVLGSLLGIGLGWLFTENVNAIKDFLAERMGIQIFPADIYLFREIPTIWDWGNVAWIAGGSLLIALLAAFVPAARAARMDPVRALRYE